MSINIKSVITDPSSLYGRNKSSGLLDKLFSNAGRYNNLQIVGERRFGKTSVLRCLETILNTDTKYIPVFIDLKEYTFVKGNANVYRFILSRSAQELSKKGLLDDEVSLKGQLFKKHLHWEDFYEGLLSVSDYRMNDLLKEFYSFFSEYYSTTFVLLIDEYEHLFLYSFEDPKGFFLFRNIGQSQIDGKLASLCFIIAGNMTWDKLCTITGSAELNTLSTEILYVDPLRIESFVDWYTEKLSPSIPNIAITPKQLYDLSGGVPFYAIVIAESLSSNHKISFNILYPHFEEVYRNLDEREINLLKQIIHSENPAKNNYVIQVLINKGLVGNDSKNLEIKSSLFREYLLSKIDLKKNVLDDEQSQLYKRVSEIFQKMSSINETCENKTKPIIFRPVNQDPFLQNDLQIKCIDSDDIKRFASAAYLTVFEKTKDVNKQLKLLPLGFQAKNDFVKIIDSLRHFFGGHLKDTFSLRPGQLSKGDLLLKILKSTNDPVDSDYVIIQKYILTGFLQYLKDIDKFVKDPQNNQLW